MDFLFADSKHGANERYQARSFHALERVVGIEPTSSAWKAEVLPLNYTRQVMPLIPDSAVYAAPMVEGVGFEPTKA